MTITGTGAGYLDSGTGIRVLYAYSTAGSGIKPTIHFLLTKITALIFSAGRNCINSRYGKNIPVTKLEK